MDRIRMIALLLAAVILLSLFGSGCAVTPDEPDLTPAPTEGSPSEVPATAEPDGVPVRLKNGGELSFLPEEQLSIPKLSRMPYARPDAEKLIADIEALTAKVPGCGDADELLNEYYDVAKDVHNFESMNELAFFRFSMDTSDDYYSGEYDYCDERNAVVQEKKNALFAAFAASPLRDALEKAYFGEGFFADYDQFTAANDTFYDLKQRENDLLFRYYELSGNTDLSSYKKIEQSHAPFAELFIELVGIRGEIAAAKGFDNYMDYCYACDFKRDYTTAQTREYLSQVKTLLAPLLTNHKITNEYSWYSDWNESKAIEMLSSAAESMGGPIWESFRFMSEYELYDISYSSNKLNTGYTDYIHNYEAPVIFADPSGRDIVCTLFHEFGHYTDYYCSYGFSGNYELAETYSQAMQYLAFAYAEPFSDRNRETNLRATLSDLLVYSILRQAAFCDFEMRVYSLAPEELTIDGIDAVYAQCMEDYGLSSLDQSWSKEKYWSAYSHFFTYPGYVISYSVSGISSLQICRMEAEEPGSGVAAFRRLLDRTRGKKYLAVMEEAGLGSPFDEAVMEQTAAFLKKAFDME